MSARINILARAAAMIAPPKKSQPINEFAKSMRLPDGPYAGAMWDPSTEPAQKILLDEIASRRWRKALAVWPSQRGKTLSAILCPALHAITEEGRDVAYVMPSLDKLNQNWTGKIRPSIEGSGFAAWLPAKGSGSRGGRASAQRMTSPDKSRRASLYFMAAGKGKSETAVSAVSPSVIVIDEADDFASVGQINLACKRIESHGAQGRAYIGSTVNARSDRDAHPVLQLYAMGSMSRLAHRCQHCSEYVIPEWEHVDVDAASIACEKCGAVWSEDQRHAALSECRITHKNTENPEDKNQLGLLCTCLDFHMGSLADICSEYRAAKALEEKGDWSMLATFTRKQLCRKYEKPAPAGAITSRALAMRSAQASYQFAALPEWSQRIAVAIDIQADRCYWLTMASGTKDRLAIIEWGEKYWARKDETATDAMKHAVLDEIKARAGDGWPMPDGSILRPDILGVDIGYDRDAIGRWCAGKSGVIPVRGETSDRARSVDIAGRSIRQDSPKAGSELEREGIGGMYEIRRASKAAPGMPSHWWFVRSQIVREHLASRWLRPIETDSAIHLPRGVAAEDPIVRHLTAWRLEVDAATGIGTWARHGAREDYADCAIYCTALLAARAAPRQRKPAGNLGSFIQ